MSTKNKIGVILHGEAMIFNNEIPNTAVKKTVEGAYFVIAPSETTGNHHVVDVYPGVDIYENTDGTLFMDAKVDTFVRCVVADRHSAIKIKAGTYEFGTQMEYDPFTARLNKVRD